MNNGDYHVDVIDLWVDELTNCLIDNDSGDEMDTEVIYIDDWNILENYNKTNGWYVNWQDWPENTEVYAIRVVGSNDYEGLISVFPNESYQSADIRWAVAAPHNNPQIVGHNNKRYDGVGGHLFAIAAQCSIDWGFDGGIVGNASKETLLEHYVEIFNAIPARIRHPYHFVIPPQMGRNLLEQYTLIFR